MVTNIAAYKFASLEDLKGLRERLQAFCKQRSLKGTILLAPEGINLFVAGAAEPVEELIALLRAIPALADLPVKVSLSDEQPFNRMLVRLKKEIIAFGVDGLDPVNSPAPRLEAATLKAWLDEGRPLVLLDTRNDYEMRLGTFDNAVQLDIHTFRDFPRAAEGLPEEMKQQPVVTFCTGGIRCEKAAPLLQKMGFEQVWQLDGGILKYFEEVGSDHYQGECFVFDRRVGVDPALAETDTYLCFACQSPLTAEQYADPRYLEGISCPLCYRDEEQKRLDNLQRRQEAIDRVIEPLPGSTKAQNRRPLNIPGKLDGATLGVALATLFPHIAETEWDSVCLLAPDGSPADRSRVVRSGERYERVDFDEIEPAVNGRLRVIYEDAAIIVLDKPAPLPIHPSGRFNRNTVRHILALAWFPEQPRIAHRLDANTSGVLLCSRSQHYARRLQPLFERNEIEKTYLALVHGHPTFESLTIYAPLTDEPGPAGIRAVTTEGGLPATTKLHVIELRDDGTALVEAHPVTGRTHQIRAHLHHIGFPIVGDPAYRNDGQAPTQTLPLDAPPMHLHSWKLSFIHPVTREQMTFTAPAPW